MKQFHDFDPVHPFKCNDNLQIQNRKIILSHIPLKDSVSIRGYLPAETYGDLKSNTFFVDYREEDGYRSANGVVIFDTSHDGEFVDVDYLGVGTVLRAVDMNDVANSLNHLDSVSTELSILLGDYGTHMKYYNSQAIESLDNHNNSDISHKNIRESINAVNDSFNYRLDTATAQINGLNQYITTISNSLQREIEIVGQSNHSLINEANDYTDEQILYIDKKINSLNDQITGVINHIDDGDSYVEQKIEALSDKIENDLNVERRSAITARNNLKREIYERTANDIHQQLDDYDLSVANRLNNFDLLFKSSLEAVNDRISEVSSNLDEYYAHTTAIIADFDDKFDDITAEIDSINSKFGSLSSSTNDALDSLTDGFADLTRTVYQARQAVNNQLDSMSTDIVLANQNLTYSRTLFENKIQYIDDLTESVKAGFDAMVDSFDDELDSMSAGMQTFFDAMIDSFNTQYTSMMTGANEATAHYNDVSESISAAIERFNTIEDNLSDSIRAAVDFSPVEDSIQRAYDYIWIITNPINQSIDDLAYSLENINFDLTPVENSIKSVVEMFDSIDVDFTPVESSINANASSIKAQATSLSTTNSNVTKIQTSLGTTNSNVTKIQTSLGTTNSNVTKIQTSLNSIESRLKTLENGNASKPLLLSSVVGTQNGQMWFVP